MDAQTLVGGQSVLVLGDGDLSFSVSLARLRGPAAIVATTYDSVEAVRKRYPDAPQHITELSALGALVLHSIDATSLQSTLLSTSAARAHVPFSSVVFNFPHIGGKSNIGKNRELLHAFFRSVLCCISAASHVYVSLAVGQGGTALDQPREWDNHWQVVSKAARSGLSLQRACAFDSTQFSEYHCRGRRSSNAGFVLEGAMTHVFVQHAVAASPLWPPIHEYYQCDIPNDRAFMCAACLQSIDELHVWLGALDVSTLPVLNAMHNILLQHLGDQYEYLLVGHISHAARAGAVQCRVSEHFTRPCAMSSLPLECTMDLSCETSLAELHALLARILPCHIEEQRACVCDTQGHVIAASCAGRWSIFLDWICMQHFHINDYRLLWSNDASWHAAWLSSPPYVTVGLFFVPPQCCRPPQPPLLEPHRYSLEISLWLLPGFTDEGLFVAVRLIAGLAVESMAVVSSFEDAATMRTSRNYVLVLSSPDRPLERELGLLQQ